MNRRNLVKTMLALPVAGAVSACRREPEHRVSGALKFILQGPFGVVLHPQNAFRIKAVIPFDSEGLHEFRFGNPARVQSKQGSGSTRTSYHFVLGEEGLEITGKKPRIDAGFYDFFFPHLGDPKKQDYFVTLDLPAPDAITYTPPAQPVLFGSRVAMSALNHIFEYTVRDPSKVRLHSEQLGEQAPLPCSDLYKDYQEGWSNLKQPTHPEESQYNNIEENLKAAQGDCSAFFIGVGLDPNTPPLAALAHAFAFFNQDLVRSFPDAPPRLRENKLQPIGECNPPAGRSAENAPPMLMPAVWRGDSARPHLLQVSSYMDCQGTGVMGTHP